MSHKLTIRGDGIVELAYAGEVPWHGLGTQVEEAMTGEEVREKAHLNWLVDTGPMFGPDGKTTVPGWYCSYRADNNLPLGCGRSKDGSYDYVPWQNHEATEWMESLVKDGRLLFESAGSIYDGRQVFFLARLTEDVEICGEQHRSYLLVNIGHDIATTTKITPTDVRVICRNTLQLALRRDEALVINKIYHRSKMHQKLGEVAEILDVTTESSRRLKVFMEKASKVRANKVFEPVMRSVLNIPLEAYPDLTDDSNPKAIRDKMDRFLEIYAEEQKLNGPNVYSLINAVTGYVDHGLSYQGKIDEDMTPTEKLGVTTAKAERRFTSIERGRAQDLKTNALAIIRTAVPA